MRTLAQGTVAALRGRARGLTPCVLKPAVPTAGGRSAIPVADDEELGRQLAKLPEDRLMLLQEVARNPHLSVNVVIGRDGQVVARTQHVTLRTWPLAAGRTALAIGVTPDEDLVERVAELLRRCGFWGLAEVQLMQTDRWSAPIDVNTRYYATMELAHASGVNLAAAWHAVALGLPVSARGSYRSGVSFRWWEADLSAALRGAPGPLASRPRRPASVRLGSRRRVRRTGDCGVQRARPPAAPGWSARRRGRHSLTAVRARATRSRTSLASGIAAAGTLGPPSAAR